MFTIIGVVVVLVAVLAGYLMHHGQLAILLQWNEFVILGGAGFGSFMAAHGMTGVKGAIQGVLGLLKPDPYTE